MKKLITYLVLSITMLVCFGQQASKKHVFHDDHDGIQLVKKNAFTRVKAPLYTENQANARIESTGLVLIEYSDNFPQEAREAIEYARSILNKELILEFDVVVEADWVPLEGNTLASAGPNVWFLGVPNAPDQQLWYPAALAHEIRGRDINGTDSEIVSRFNSNGDWYFGTDANPPADKIDMVSVALHEFCHGLGFLGGITQNGAGDLVFNFDQGEQTVYDSFVFTWRTTDSLSNENTPIFDLFGNQDALSEVLLNFGVQVNGSEVEPVVDRRILHLPSTWQQGSSYGHWREGRFPAGDVNSLMTPIIQFSEANHDIGTVTRAFFSQMGYTMASTTSSLTANYTVDKSVIDPGQQVQFFDVSVGEPTSWSWEFEGGTPATSTLENPVVTFANGGSFDVTLIVNNAEGADTLTRADFISVRDLVQADFSATRTTIEEGESIVFSDNSTGNVVSRTWAFEGGNPETVTDQENVTVTYETGGTYDVTLTVRSSSDSSTTTKAGFINVTAPVDVDIRVVDNLEGSNGFEIVDGTGTPGNAGDFNGDGLDDIILRDKIILSDSTIGSTFSLTEDSASIVRFVSSTNEINSFKIESAGDLNGDGIGDVIVGNFSNSAKIYVVFGSNSPATEIDINTLSAGEGMSIGLDSETVEIGIDAFAGIGDLNNDGFDDMMLADPILPNNQTPVEGIAWCIFGRDNLPADFQLDTINGTDGSLGFFIAGIAPEVPVSQPGGAGGFGSMISKAGDVNGDNIDDAVIVRTDNSFFERSEAVVIYGNANGFGDEFNLNDIDGTNGFFINRGTTPREGAYFVDVASIGDFNNDGFDDLAFKNGIGLGQQGIHYVYYGSANAQNITLEEDLNGSNGFKIEGLVNNQSSKTIGGGEDFNGDGIDDLVISILPAFTQDTRNNGTFVLYGGTRSADSLNFNSIDRQNGFLLKEGGSRSGFNFSAVLGDFNNDQTADIVTGNVNGGMYVYFGGTSLSSEENYAPVPVSFILSENNLEIGFEADTVDLTGAFTDEDGDSLTYSIEYIDENAPLIVEATIADDQIIVKEVGGTGFALFLVVAEDGKGGRGTADVYYNITGPNFAPTVANPIEDKRFSEGFGSDTTDLATVFEDRNTSDFISYSFSVANSDVVNVSLTGSLLILDEVAQGTVDITVTATDPDTAFVSDQFSVTITPPNSAPAVDNPIDDRTLEEGFESETIDFSSVFIDADGDDLSFSVSVDSDTVVSVSIENGTELIITEVAFGTATVTLTADDGIGGPQDDVFTVTVEDINFDPEIAVTFEDQELEEGFGFIRVELSDAFSDRDGDQLVYDATSSDEGVVSVLIDNETSRLTVLEEGIGTATITITADDQNGGSSSSEFDVIVSEPLAIDPDGELVIYPNPATDHISISTSKKVNQVILQNLAGKMIRSKLNAKKMSLAGVAGGIYVIKVITETSTEEFKIVIK